MGSPVTFDEVDRQFHLLRSEPQKFLALTDELVRQRPDDARAYFSRHWAGGYLNRPDLALADLDKSIALAESFTAHEARGDILHGMGRYHEAIAAFDRSEAIESDAWRDGFGPLFRADCHARLGDEAAALADCATLPEDHWTPGMLGVPAGNREEVAATLRRLAAAARAGSSDAGRGRP